MNQNSIHEYIQSQKLNHLTLDFSAMSTYRTCPKKFLYRYILGFDTESSDPLAFGSAIHKALAVWHMGGNSHKTNAECQEKMNAAECIRCSSVIAFRESANTSVIAQIASDERRSVAWGEKLMWAYFQAYNLDPFNGFRPAGKPSADGKTVEPLIELKLEYPINDWLTYNGRCDMVGALPDGKLATIEHKTTSYLGKGFYDKAKPNDQITGYMWLARKVYNYDISTSVLNGLQTVTTKLEKDPGSCFARVTTHRTEGEIAEWLKDTTQVATRIMEDLSSGSFWRNAPDACTQWNTHCSYADVCNASEAQRLPILRGSFKESPWENFQLVKKESVLGAKNN